MTKNNNLTVVTILLTLCGILFSTTSSADIYKCKTPLGKIKYQGTPCKKDKTVFTKKAPLPKKPIFEMHASWFSKPPVSHPKIKCGLDSCTCGKNTFHTIKNKKQHLNNAMSSLPNTWRESELYYKAYLKRNNKNLFNKVTKYSCLVTWNQNIITELYPKISKSMLQDIQVAKDEIKRAKCRDNFIRTAEYNLNLSMDSGQMKRPQGFDSILVDSRFKTSKLPCFLPGHLTLNYMNRQLKNLEKKATTLSSAKENFKAPRKSKRM